MRQPVELSVHDAVIAGYLKICHVDLTSAYTEMVLIIVNLHTTNSSVGALARHGLCHRGSAIPMMIIILDRLAHVVGRFHMVSLVVGQ